MMLAECEGVAEDTDAGLWVRRGPRGRIKIWRLSFELRITRDVHRVRRRASQREQSQQQDCFHFDTTPTSPPEINEATFVRILGSTNPPGDARYLGSHSGSNFSLYSLSPWKL